MLEQKLTEALHSFKEEVEFHLETFNQTHQDENLTKDDLEFIGRQVFYCLHSFKDAIVDTTRKEGFK